MNNKKTICFACGTEFHLLVTYIISTTIYSDDKKVLFLYNQQRLQKYIQIIKTINLWDEVVIWDPSEGEEVCSQLVRKWSKEGDVLHYYSWGYHLYNNLFNEFVNNGKPVILTDEGIDSYAPFKRFQTWRENSKLNKEITNSVDLKNAQEIWVFNPNLFCDQNILGIKKINIEKFYVLCQENNEVVQNFKTIFFISNDFSFSYEIVYFRQYHSLIKKISPNTDAFIDSMICNFIKYSRCFIKNHPAYIKNPYVEIIPVDVNINIPWEVIVILAQIEPSLEIKLPNIFISAASSAMFTTNSLNISGDFIFLDNIYADYALAKSETVDKLIETSKEIFPKSHFYSPSNWQEFFTIIKNLDNDKEKILENDSFIETFYEKEKVWLKDQLVQNWQLLLTKEEKISEQLQNIQNLKKQVVSYEDKIQIVSEQAIEHEKIVQILNEKVAEKEGIINKFNIKVFEMEEIINTLTEKIQKEEEIIEIVSCKNLELEQEVVDYVLSRSWRATRPFRLLHNLIKGKK